MKRFTFSIRTTLLAVSIVAVALWIFSLPDWTKTRLIGQIKRGDYSQLLSIDALLRNAEITEPPAIETSTQTFSDWLLLRRKVRVYVTYREIGSTGGCIVDINIQFTQLSCEHRRLMD